jgi:hypothetical protein
MPIDFPCPSCDESIRVSRKYAGKAGRCPKCRARVQVPDDIPGTDSTPKAQAPPPAKREKKVVCSGCHERIDSRLEQCPLCEQPREVEATRAESGAELADLADLMEHFGVSQEQADDWIQRLGCPQERQGGQLGFDLQAVAEWREERDYATSNGPFAPLPDDLAAQRKREMKVAFSILGVVTLLLAGSANQGAAQTVTQGFLIFVVPAVAFLGHRVRKWNLATVNPGAWVEGNPGQGRFIMAGLFLGGGAASSLSQGGPAGLIGLAVAVVLGLSGSKHLEQGLRSIHKV